MVTILVAKKSMTPVDIHVHVFKDAGSSTNKPSDLP